MSFERASIARLKEGDIGGLAALVETYQLQAVRTAYLIVTLPGEPCRVACEPRYAAEVAERLAADGQPCYAVVEAWQLI